MYIYMPVCDIVCVCVCVYVILIYLCCFSFTCLTLSKGSFKDPL